MAFIMVDNQFIDPRQRSWIFASMENTALLNRGLSSNGEEEIPLLTEEKYEVLLEHVDLNIGRSMEFPEVASYLRRIFEYKYTQKSNDSDQRKWTLGWQDPPVREHALGFESNNKWIWTTLDRLRALTCSGIEEDRPDDELAFSWLIALESCKDAPDELKASLRSLQSSLESGAIHLPAGAWDFFKVEVLRLRGQGKDLPLALDDFKRIERSAG